MKRTIKQALKTGYGLGLLTIAEARKIASSAKKELNLNENESRKLAKELVATSSKVSTDVLRIVNHYFESAVLRSGLVKKSELKAAKGAVRKKFITGLKMLRTESAFQKLKRHAKKHRL